MIFTETMKNTAPANEVVTESPYELGIGGALMHVYENECNYNALMKAAALSEMKYYNENGGDLFVQEAGAFSSLLQKVKAFFVKVIEKIKSIAHKFMAKINQYVMKDKDFVKKYKTEVLRRDLKDFEFNGYKFENFATFEGDTSETGVVSDVKKDGKDDQDALNDIMDKNRGKILRESGSFTEAEFRSELKEKLYGDKEDFPVDIRKWFGVISDSKSLIDAAKKAEKEAIKGIEDIIKKIQKDIDDLDKKIDSGLKDNTMDDKEKEEKDGRIKGWNNEIAVYKAFSNDVTIYFGAKVKALNDKNRQAKAICVKALSYKHESAPVAESGYDNIFAGVEIV